MLLGFLWFLLTLSHLHPTRAPSTLFPGASATRPQGRAKGLQPGGGFDGEAFCAPALQTRDSIGL